jgi:high-affinity iron transporter
MLAAAIIVFREMLEAALIVGIVLAAARGLEGRHRWVAIGVGAGLAGAGVVAAFAGAIASALEGIGQELFNAGVLLLAVLMLGWHNVWMSRHARELAARMQRVGAAVLEGSAPLWALALVVGLALLREGSEVALFLYGLAVGSAGSSAPLLVGGALGLLGGAAVGTALYLGLLRIPTRYLVTVTGWLILLLAAGMAAQAAGFLEQAGVLPALGRAVWDTSRALPEHSLLGQLLHTLVGYDARPSGIQLVFYLATLAAIGGLMRLSGRPATRREAVSRTA